MRATKIADIAERILPVSKHKDATTTAVSTRGNGYCHVKLWPFEFTEYEDDHFMCVDAPSLALYAIVGWFFYYAYSA